MGNMSYCRYRNTASDLSDCFESLYDDIRGATLSISRGEDVDMSPSEFQAMRELVGMCREIADEFDIEVGNL